ncbi:hypothetical protein B566_EDAN014897 [Ephemera danica]|nr:hypothetical protein B566_EDAN014897 [Ephemera danica]
MVDEKLVREMSCIVSSCGKSRFTCKDDTHFHCFPKDPELSEKWRIALRRSRRHAPITKSSLVCSLHFKSSDYSSLPNVNGFKARIKLKSTAVPSIFPPRDKIKKSQLLKHAARLQAAKAEKMKTEADADPGNPTGKGKQSFQKVAGSC